ncbi:MAG: c-type cytochrome [Brevundimonas sp.]
MSATVRAVAIALVCAFGASCSSSPTAVSPRGARPEASAGYAAEAMERGRLLTSTACAGCHATGATGDSPLADATPLREIVRRYPLDRLEGAFAEGLVTSHPAMPAYVFRASEIDDLIAYLESLRAQP